MLNIIKSKIKNTYKKKALNNETITKKNKDFVPAVRDWKNSIYVYNKNTLSLIPVASRLVMKLFKGYFNSYNLYTESKLRKSRLRRRYRKLSTNKIFISNGEFKHTNDKVNITLYVYNKQKLNYLRLHSRSKELTNKYLYNWLFKLQDIRMSLFNKQQIKSKTLTNVLPNYTSKLYIIQNLYSNKFLYKVFNCFNYYLYSIQLLYINKAKFENSYIQGLIDLIKKIYKKNIELNIINLKYFYLNSDIYTQPIVLKLRKKRKLLRYLNAIIRKVKINKLNRNKRSRYYFQLENLYKLNNLDTTNNILNNLMQYNKKNSEYLFYNILNNIKYKRVSGVRVEAAGRLSKRFTAARSQYKVKYRGNLENVDSSIWGHRASLIRGNDRPNLQYTNLNSKSRIGSFGIKGWVSGI